MNRRSFLKAGTLAAAAIPSMGLGAPAEGRAFVEVLVPSSRICSGPSPFADRRGLLGLASRAGRLRAHLVLAGAPSARARSETELRQANDRLAALCGAPGAALSALADLGPQPSARELERCVRRLGLQGGTLRIESSGLAARVRALDPVFEAAERLGVPLHIAPAGPASYGWSRAVTEAFLAAGSFERFAGLTIIIDGADDELAWSLARIDERPDVTLRSPPSQLLRRSLFVTTSGLNYHPALRDLVRALGSDRVLYASDRPFRYDQALVAAAMPFAADDVARIMKRNAERLFRLA